MFLKINKGKIGIFSSKVTQELSIYKTDNKKFIKY